MQFAFEPTASFCYKFSRYQALPEILEMSEVKSGEPFRLIDFVKQIVDKYLTSEQQVIKIKRAKSDRTESVVSDIKFYVPFIAKNTGQLIRVGGGLYRLPAPEDIDEDEVRESALEDGDTEAAEYDGWIYAFSFPILLRSDQPFPIKIGMTLDNVDARVSQQCKGSAMFDNPVILGRWPVKRVGFVEAAIHNVLRSRGKWRENIPSREWFNTTIEEIEAIAAFISA
jgi:hypothetical protein